MHWIQHGAVLALTGVLMTWAFFLQLKARDRFLVGKARRGLFFCLLGLGCQAIETTALGNVLALAGILELGTLMALNPWWLNRVSQKLPPILQDAIVAASVGVFATMAFPDRLYATSAVSAVILGLAFQDTLGNLLAGLAIQTERPFEIGNWVSIGGHEGKVIDMSWRATKLLTKEGNVIALPNQFASKEAVINYSEPSPACRFEIELCLPHPVAPEFATEVLLRCLSDLPDVLPKPVPEVLLKAFEPPSLRYAVRFWSARYDRDDSLRSAVRLALWYGLRRAGIDPPIPEQVVFSNPQRSPSGGHSSQEEMHLKLLAQVDLFAGLPKEALSKLYKASHQQLFARQQSILRAGDQGTSLYVILKGSAVVSTPAGAELATLTESQYFGEMSFLTGAQRTANVVAASQCTVLEIPSEAFRRQIRRFPQLLEAVSAVVASRGQELSLKTAQAVAPSSILEPQSMLERIRDFLLSPLGPV